MNRFVVLVTVNAPFKEANVKPLPSIQENQSKKGIYRGILGVVLYSALNKIYHAFMHTVAVTLFVGLMAAAAQTPIEIAAKLGYAWARHVIAYFAEGGSR